MNIFEFQSESSYGIGLHIQKEQDEKCSPAKNQPVKANWKGDTCISIFT